MIDALKLGATLYIPAIKDNLAAIANGEKYPQLRSMVFCTEDSIYDRDIDKALAHIGELLEQIEDGDRLRFIRARNPKVLERLLALPNIERITGFVFPKLDINNVGDYFSQVADTDFKNMPTLETRDVFEQAKMCRLRDELIAEDYQQSILALRIGGNDLLQHLGLRRPVNKTLYETPVGLVIYQLINTFRPYGFALTAPVFEHINNLELLQKETLHDASCGLFAKTAIHPTQIAHIESCYKVREKDLKAAEAILHDNAAAVFKMNDSMCEVATHRAWAHSIIRRCQVYGKLPDPA